MRRSIEKVAAFGITIALTAIVIHLLATSPAPSAPARSASAGRAVQGRIDTSDVKEYTSLQALRQDATSVAILRPSSVTRIEMIKGIPFTVTTASVVQTVSGPSLPSTIELRQTGDGNDPDYPVVSDTESYLAYLQPFELQPGVPVGNEYVVIGSLQGLFVQTRSGTAAPPAGPPSATTTFDRVDPSATALPSTITLQQAQSS